MGFENQFTCLINADAHRLGTEMCEVGVGTVHDGHTPPAGTAPPVCRVGLVTEQGCGENGGGLPVERARPAGKKPGVCGRLGRGILP